MNKYQLSFWGRTNGAIGIKHNIQIIIDANSPEEAVVIANKTYEVWHGTPGLKVEIWKAPDYSWLDKGLVQVLLDFGKINNEQAEEFLLKISKGARFGKYGKQ